ncbi:hypothetical protein BH11MYX4_BH11MYX4_25190 [soil metagenome]
MRKIASRSWALCALLAAGCVTGCSSEPEAPPDGTLEDPLGAALARDTGVPWFVKRDAEGTVVVAVPLGAPKPISSGPAGEVAREFYRRYASHLGIVSADDELQLVDVRESPGAGVRDVLFNQRAAGSGLPVWAGGSAIHLSPDGSFAWAQPTFVSGTRSLPSAAATTPDQAVVSARDAIARAMPGLQDGALARAPELGVHAMADGPHLAYAVGLTGAAAAPLAFVDALDGHVLEVRDTMSGFIATAFTARHYLPVPFSRDDKRSFLVLPPSLVNNWYMEQPSIPNLSVGVKVRSYVASVGAIASGDLIQADLTSPLWDDTERRGAGSAVDAYTNVNQVIEWFADPSKLNYRSFDGKGMEVRVFVHRDLQGSSAGYAPGDDSINFADIIPGTITPPAVALDIAAHEFTHGVTNHAAGIGWAGTNAQQAPLDEALSDIFAATLEHDVKPGPGNMQFGEELGIAGKTGYRDHLEPASRDVVNPQLDAMPDPNWTGWAQRPYVSAGIPTRAWSLMVTGGEHRGVGMPAALGWELTRDLFWESLQSLRAHPALWTPRALAWSQIGRARMDGRKFTHEQIDTVACAWSAVNALDSTELATLRTLGIAQTCSSAPKTGPISPANECAGHGNATVCSAVPGLARICKNGIPVNDAFCADLAQACQKTSPDDPTAQLTGDGALICE